jgi:hypothetical protein
MIIILIEILLLSVLPVFIEIEVKKKRLPDYSPEPVSLGRQTSLIIPRARAPDN